MALHSRHIIYLMAATAFTVLQTSCCKDKDVEVSSEIVLSASLAQTRGVIASADAMEHESDSLGTGIGVFGYKTNDGENPQQIFSDTKVTFTNNSWTYSPKKFWDKYAYYHFVAYWPKELGHGMSVSNHVSNTGTRTLIINDIPNWQNASGDASDILLAYSQNSAKNYFAEDPKKKGIVHFKFRHMLAQVTIKAWYYGIKENKPSIKHLSIGSSEHPVSYEDGKSVIQQIYSTRTDPTYTGPTVSGDATLIESLTGDSVHQYFETEEQYDSISTTTMCTWLAVPYGMDTSASVPISIDYTFGTGSQQHKDGLVSLGYLEAGKTYVVILKFDSSGERLNLEDILVKDWQYGSKKTPFVYNW